MLIHVVDIDSADLRVKIFVLEFLDNGFLADFCLFSKANKPFSNQILWQL